jgi:ribosomal protein L14E/L6E/L27E
LADVIPAVVGRVCLSKSGRDKDRYFVVTEVMDESYVMIADGVMRKLSKPKRKKIRHLSMKPVVLDVIAEKLETGKKVFDAELKSAIINTGLIAQKEG